MTNSTKTPSHGKQLSRFYNSHLTPRYVEFVSKDDLLTTKKRNSCSYVKNKLIVMLLSMATTFFLAFGVRQIDNLLENHVWNTQMAPYYDVPKFPSNCSSLVEKLKRELKFEKNVIRGLKRHIEQNNQNLENKNADLGPDYALQSLGASVVEFTQDRSYWSDFATNFFEGRHLNIILHPSMIPGHCFTFNGHNAFFKIRLARAIRVKYVAVEHVSRKEALDITNAPKYVNFYSEMNGTKYFLGSFKYEVNGPTRQVFRVHIFKETNQITDIIHVEVVGNHGNVRETCLYKIGVFAY